MERERDRGTETGANRSDTGRECEKRWMDVAVREVPESDFRSGAQSCIRGTERSHSECAFQGHRLNIIGDNIP